MYTMGEYFDPGVITGHLFHPDIWAQKDNTLRQSCKFACAVIEKGTCLEPLVKCFPFPFSQQSELFKSSFSKSQFVSISITITIAQKVLRNV